MKLLKLLKSRSHSEEVKPPRLVESSEEETVASETCPSLPLEPLAKVRFDEESNVYIDCPWEQREDRRDDATISWYTREDVCRFKMEVSVAGNEARLKEKLLKGNSSTWSLALLTAYDRCQTLDSSEDIRELLATAKNFGPVDAEYVGLDRWALPEIKSLRSSVRKTLQLRVRHVQFRTSNPVKQAKDLLRVSREVSRTSRFYALFLGKMMEHEMSKCR